MSCTMFSWVLSWTSLVRRSWESRDATILASILAAAILPLCVCAFSTPSVGRHGRVRTTPVAMKAGSSIGRSSGRLLRAQAFDPAFHSGVVGGAGSTQWPLAPCFEVHAMSMSTEDRSSFTECVDGIIDFLQADERSHRAALIVGESTGAVLALGAALRTPEAISGLCLINPATSYGQAALRPCSPAPKLPTSWRRWVSNLRYAPAFISPIFGKPNWFNTVVAPRLDSEQKRRATSATAQGLPSLVDLFAASEALASVLPAEALEWRLQALLSDGSAEVNAALEARRGGSLESVSCSSRGSATVLPSARKSSASPLCFRRRSRAPRARCYRAQRTRAWMTRAESAAGARTQQVSSTSSSSTPSSSTPSRARPAATSPAAARPAAAAAGCQGRREGRREGCTGASDPAPQSLFEGWLGQMRQLFSPSSTPQQPTARLLEASGSAALMGRCSCVATGCVADGPLLIEEVLREHDRLIRPWLLRS